MLINSNRSRFCRAFCSKIKTTLPMLILTPSTRVHKGLVSLFESVKQKKREPGLQTQTEEAGLKRALQGGPRTPAGGSYREVPQHNWQPARASWGGSGFKPLLQATCAAVPRVANGAGASSGATVPGQQENRRTDNNHL